MKAKAQRLVNYLRENPRNENDLEAAAIIEKMTKVYLAAHDMVYAKTHQASQAAYSEMHDIFKGKPHE